MDACVLIEFVVFEVWNAIEKLRVDIYVQSCWVLPSYYALILCDPNKSLEHLVTLQ
jgi:hypothetical protein